MKKSIVSALLIACLVSLLATGCGKKGNVITIGLNNEITGAIPVVGESSKNGCNLAIKEINDAGGITIDGKKYKLEIEMLDNEFKPESSASVAQKFANSAEIMAMIGPNDSADCMPCAPIVEAAKLPTITPWATAPPITKDRKYFFRGCYTDDFQGAVIAKFAFGNEKAKTAAVLYDMTNDYNVGVANIFKATFEKLGGKVVGFQTYGRGDKDFKSQLTKIIAANPDILLFPNFYQEVPLQAEQARSLGFKGKFIGSDTWGSVELLKLGGKYVEGALWCGHYAVDIASDQAKQFITAYEKNYKKTPDDVAALNYDSVKLLAVAIQKSGKINRVAIRNALASIPEYVGVTGTMKFTGTGDPTKSAVIIQIKNGKFMYYATAQP